MHHNKVGELMFYSSLYVKIGRFYSFACGKVKKYSKAFHSGQEIRLFLVWYHMRVRTAGRGGYTIPIYIGSTKETQREKSFYEFREIS